MGTLHTFDASNLLLIVVLISGCIYKAVNAEDCVAVSNSHCHCRTASGYEIDLSPLASHSSEPA